MRRMPARKPYQTIKRVAMAGGRDRVRWKKINLSCDLMLLRKRNIFYECPKIAGNAAVAVAY
jgi:hypothetical protein